MFTTNKEIFNKINNVIDNYNNYTFEWLFEDLFNKPNKQFSIKKPKKKLANSSIILKWIKSRPNLAVKKVQLI